LISSVFGRTLDGVDQSMNLRLEIMKTPTRSIRFRTSGSLATAQDDWVLVLDAMP
jgi:hypothetical protein